MAFRGYLTLTGIVTAGIMGLTTCRGSPTKRGEDGEAVDKPSPYEFHAFGQLTLPGYHVDFISTADLDGDGDPDLIVGLDSYARSPASGSRSTLGVSQGTIIIYENKIRP